MRRPQYKAVQPGLDPLRWWRLVQGGFNDGTYRWTHAIGDYSDTTGVWAHWDFGSRVGKQEVQIWIPSAHAEATVKYFAFRDGKLVNVRDNNDGSTSTWRINQEYFSTKYKHRSGIWVIVGFVEANGGTVRIAVYDDHAHRSASGGTKIAADAIRIRCVSDCTNTYHTTSSTDPPAQVPQPIVFAGNSRFTVSWDEPSSSSTLIGYDIRHRSRRADGVVGYWKFAEHPSNSLRVYHNTNAMNGTTYEVQVRARNRNGEGPWSPVATIVPYGFGYLQDRPNYGSEWERHDEGIGHPAIWSQIWKRPFEALLNGIQRLIDLIPSLDRYESFIKTEDRYSHDIEPRDSISTIHKKRGRTESQYGANGYSVVHYSEPHSARWLFRNVLPGKYSVEVFVPSPKDKDKRPGAIVGYFVSSEVLKNGSVTGAVNQSLQRYRGEWVPVQMIELLSTGDVFVAIQGSQPSRQRGGVPGKPEWRNNVAVDAARLTPAGLSQCETFDDSSRRCWNYDLSGRDIVLRDAIMDARVRCVVDIFFMPYWDAVVDAIDELWGDHIRKALIEEVILWMITLALSATASAVSAGTATPVVVAAIMGKIALSANRIVRLLQQIRRISPWVDDVIRYVKSVANQLDDFKKMGDTILTVFDLLLTGLDVVTDSERRAREISEICEDESVWENYLGRDHW